MIDKNKIKVFFDTNILVYVLDENIQFQKETIQALSIAFSGDVIGYMSTLSLCDAFHIVRKKVHKNERQIILTTLLSKINIVNLTKTDIRKSAFGTFSDFEDGIQYECAKRSGCDLIVTYNKKDFKNSTIPVFDAYEFNYMCEKLLKNKLNCNINM